MYIVEFPGLWGLKLSINPIAFSVFNLDIYWYGVIISLGFMLALIFAIKSCKTYGIEPEVITDLALFGAPVSVVFARLYYVMFSWDNFKTNPISILNLRTGGLALYGALIGALVTAYLFSKYRKINPLSLIDFGIPYFVLGQAIGRWGNFVNQEAFGTNTTLPWGMISSKTIEYLGFLKAQGLSVIPDMPVHPTFLYESLWNIIVFVILLWYRARKKISGEILCLYMILYGIGRFWIEGIRTDSLYAGNVRISQALAALFAVGFAVVLYSRRKAASKSTIT